VPGVVQEAPLRRDAALDPVGPATTQAPAAARSIVPAPTSSISRAVSSAACRSWSAK
jgi:hypothetical protein